MLKKKSIIICLISAIFSFIFNNVNAINIVLDPGHGGSSPGCTRTYDGKEILEKELNYKIASYIKEELENKYLDSNGEPVNIYLTHENNEKNPRLSERVQMGIDKKAEAVISLHINASTSNDQKGSMVLVTSSHFNNLYEIEENLAKCFLKELEKIGIKPSYNSGFLRKLSDDGSKYENGETTDWYGIIEHGILKNIPAILVEHAFLSNEEDYRNYLSTDEKLRSLAGADVNAIVSYYNLILKSDETSKKQINLDA